MLKLLRRLLVMFGGISTIYLLALGCYRNVFKAHKSVMGIFKFREKVNGFQKLPKYYRANGRFFMSMNIPGFPSKAFCQFIRNELNIAAPFNSVHNLLQMAVFSVTSKCPLNCLHCFEWERIHGSEYLSLEQLLQIQHKIESYGVCQIQYTGGEPMVRVNDLIELIKATLPTTDCWIFSSGFNFSLENACRLKKAGLTGVVLSLDHWKANEHNQFRQSDKAFSWVTAAAENIVKANLALSLSLCPTRDFVTRENLFNYLFLAEKLKAGFIQILEPRKAGKYKDLDVSLNQDHLTVLEEFTFEVNNNREYSEMPTIFFPGFHQRKFGCAGAGHRFLYIDSKGNTHACPFCQGSVGSCLDKEFSQLVDDLKSKGCPEFHKTLSIRT